MMTHSWMGVLSPTPALFSKSSWILGEKKSGNWSQQENKLFENSLAHFDEELPDRWEKVAEMIPGKTVEDVMTHYHDLEADVSCIEAGLIPFPGYSSSSFTLDWEIDHGFDGLKQAYCVGGKRSGSNLAEYYRKKGVPWTEEEHRRFLIGLKKHGKGDWRNISRNFVVTRTPTQVASHAQKYFIRLSSGGKDKRRASIHDITTVTLENRSPSPLKPLVVTAQSSLASTPCTSEQLSMVANLEQHKNVASIISHLANGNQFIQSPYGILPYGMKLKTHNSHYFNLNGSVL